MSLEVEALPFEEGFELIRARGPERLGLFQELAWWDVLVEGAGLQRSAISVVRDGEPLAVMPVAARRLGPFEAKGAPLRGSFTPYVGPVPLSGASTDDVAAGLPHMVAALLASGPTHVELALREDDPVAPGLPAEGGGWRRAVQTTLVLAVSGDADEMWRGMAGRGRNMVRKAEKNGVVVRVLEGTDGDINIFYDMLRSTFRRRGAEPSHPKEFYRALSRTLGPVGMLRILSAEIDGEPVAMAVFPYNVTEVHYLSGCSTDLGRKVGASNLLQWEIIKYAARVGIPRYDLGGTGIPSIDRFKASFGAKPARYLRAEWTRPWARPLLASYLRLRPLLRRYGVATG